MPSILPHVLAFIIGTIFAVTGGTVMVMHSPELWSMPWRFCVLGLVVGISLMVLGVSNLRSILNGLK